MKEQVSLSLETGTQYGWTKQLLNGPEILALFGQSPKEKNPGEKELEENESVRNTILARVSHGTLFKNSMAEESFLIAYIQEDTADLRTVFIFPETARFKMLRSERLGAEEYFDIDTLDCIQFESDGSITIQKHYNRILSTFKQPKLKGETEKFKLNNGHILYEYGVTGV